MRDMMLKPMPEPVECQAWHARKAPGNEGFPELLRHRDRQGGRPSSQPSPRPPPWAPCDAGCNARRDTGSLNGAAVDATWPRQAAKSGGFPGVSAPGEVGITSPLFDLPPPIHGCSRVSLGLLPVEWRQQRVKAAPPGATRPSAAQLMTPVTMHSRRSSSDYRHATRARRAGAHPEPHPDRSNMPFQRDSS
jgi:hypothetical protein